MIADGIPQSTAKSMRDGEANYDVIIIGASVAGSSLAIELGRASLRVALLDKTHFPRRKPCGEGLSSAGFNRIQELIGSEQANQLPHHEFDGYTIWSRGKALEVPFSRKNTEIVRGRGIQRRYLDTALASIAGAATTVSLLQGCNVREISRCGELHCVRIDDKIITAPWLVLADGANSVLASRMGFEAENRAVHRYGYSLIAHGEYTRPVTHVNVFLEGRVEIVCTPIDSRELNVTAFVDKDSIPQITQAAWLEHILAEIKERIGFVCSNHDEPMPINIVSRKRKRCTAQGVILVGDCCETLDPIGGMGMTHALQSAELAAAALIKIIRGKCSSEAALAEYERKRRAAIRPLRGFTRLTHLLLRRSRRTPMLSMLAHTPLMSSVSRAVNSPNDSASWYSSAAMVLITFAGL